ncbi:hypothetical protein [Haloferula helveola]
MKNVAALAVLLTASAPALEVHEWGTFTTLSGSDGHPLVWYLPYREPSQLPKFVHGQGLRLKGMPVRVRMETPVIYFYPEKAGEVTVEATYRSGTITEVYPSPKTHMFFGPTPVRWTGTLVPPDDAEALSLIPAVPEGSKGDHYAAARAVPDAWIFRSSRTHVTPEEKTVTTEEAEKFIFYRGSGANTPALIAQLDASNGITLSTGSTHPHKLNIALEVKGESARWRTLTAVKDHEQVPETEILDGPMRPVREVEKEIGSWFQGSLTGEGLTSAEAAAMIDTWDETWFREEGTRVFSILPQDWVDEVLPLTVDPKPEKLVRVFVARLELIQPSKEIRLADALVDPAADFSQVEALKLGRFADGALNRAIDVQGQRMRTRFHQLQSDAAKRTSAR